IIVVQLSVPLTSHQAGNPGSGGLYKVGLKLPTIAI
ncbi:hypothetical protein PoMZ_12136, partial [Pyricularia oryzae]